MAMRWRVDRRIARAGTADTPRRRLRAQADRRRITRGRRRATRADRLRTIRVRLLPTNRLCAETMTPAFAAPALSCVAVPAGLEHPKFNSLDAMAISYCAKPAPDVVARQQNGSTPLNKGALPAVS